MAEKNISDSSRTSGSVPKWIWIPALGFTALLLTFFLTVFFVFPTLSSDRRELIHFLIAFNGGFAALFMGGTMVLHRNVPRRDLGKVAVSTTSGFALFLFLYLEPPFMNLALRANRVPVGCVAGISDMRLNDLRIHKRGSGK